MTPLFLGKTSDGARVDLDARALTTHGFILGMTGSGKTGLCVTLLEEAMRARVPVIAVDTKGDLATALLAFAPGAPAIARWTTDAAQASQRIDSALQDAGLDAGGFNAVRAGYEARLYTPGSAAGISINLLGGLTSPDDTTEASLADAADATARGLLGLLGLEADPLTSREYLLLVQLLTTAWSGGGTPTLADLVRQVGQPPFTSLGALALDDFFPPKDRQGLMVRLNGLLASPKFAAWRSGEPLDAQRLLFSGDGRPRLSVYSVAHLADEERVFTVALLLEAVQRWMRRQGGADGLRAIILLDEIFGYFPPAPANPPTKAPLLGLLKQARAFGVGVVLATQNPIDLDYRGLGNIGTWWVGRLQTEQDKQRIRDALASAAAATGATPAQLDGLIATLAPRQFLLHSVHRPQPVVYRTRDAYTLLHGPFSADEVRELAAPMKAPGDAGPASDAQATGGLTPPMGAGATTTGAAATTGGPEVPLGLEPELGPIYEVDSGTALPYLLLKFGVRYRVGTTLGEETVHEFAFPLADKASASELLEGDALAVQGVPFQPTKPAEVTLTSMPRWVSGLKASRLQALVKEHLPGKLETTLLVDPVTKLVSQPTESKEAFIARVLEKRGLSKQAQTLANRLEKKRADLAQAEKQVSTRKAQKWLSVGSGMMSLFGGRGTALGGVGRALSSNRSQDTAEARVEALGIEIQQLQQQLADLRELDETTLEAQRVLPRPGDLKILRLCYAYIVP